MTDSRLTHNPIKYNTMKVAFRFDKRGNFKEVTAVFPESNEGGNMYACYAHYGQHGSCCGEWVAEDTKPAKPEQYAPLLAELRAIGYDDLQIVDRVRWVRTM